MKKCYSVSFQEACKLLKQGEVVSIPTETVYGLAGDIQNLEAIKKIFRIKKRPLFDPLIVHFSHWEQLESIIKNVTPIEKKLSEAFHPGPLTLVLPKKDTVSNMITAGLSTVAVRIPSHPVALKLLKETQLLLAVPSANLFSKTSPTRLEHVTLPVPVLDGGACPVGIESTILQINEKKKTLFILRPGVIGVHQLRLFLKSHHFEDWNVEVSKSTSTAYPGQFKSHYAPEIPLVMVQIQKEISSDEIIQKIKNLYPTLTPKQYELSKDPYLLARNLYHDLRELSEHKECVGYVVKDSQYEGDAWQAIWNRLQKASSKIITL